MLALVRVIGNNGPIRLELSRWNGRLVVAKRLRGLSPELARRVHQEARIVSGLRHPNIIPLLAWHEETLIYDYSPGMDLGQLLDGTPFRRQRIFGIMDQLLLALEAIHARAVIHHDVKPGNIIIRGERALLTDFGFAKQLGLRGITAEHELMGTPAYMAPEQFQGRRDDPRSDLYGAGAVLYHMLEGEPPYSKDVIRFLLREENVPLRFSEATPAAFVPLLERALQPEAAARFQSAAEFRAELLRLRLSGEKLSA